MGGAHSQEEAGPRLEKHGDNFWNARAEFKVLHMINIGTHMSLIKLKNGRFLVIDTVPLDDKLKSEFDALTEKGSLVEAVLATHPFHTLAFPAFHEAYPSLRYYGCPRHLRNLSSIPWAGDIREQLMTWAPEVEMRIPAGAEFVAPEPERFNHFNSVWVYCKESRMLHVDDTVNYYKKEHVGVLLRLVGVKDGELGFHPSMKGPGLLPTVEAPAQFKCWVEHIIADWDFGSICCAHRDVLIGGAKQKLQMALDDAQPLLESLAEKNRKKEESGKGEASGSKGATESKEEEEISKMNVHGCECG